VSVTVGGPKEFNIWAKRMTSTKAGKGGVGDFEAALHRAVHQQVSDELIRETPRKTGRAQGNFQSSVGSPINTETDERSENAAKGKGQAVARKIKPFSRSFVTNNVPYLLGTNSLNDGHSTQAPAGFIEGVIDRVVDQFK